MAPELKDLVARLEGTALRQGADSAEAVARSSRNLLVEVKEGRVEGVRRTSEVSAALRVIVGGRPGFAYATDPGRHGVDDIVADAIAGSRLLSPSGENRFSSASEPGSAEEILDMTGIELPHDEKVNAALAMERAALDSDPSITKVYKPSYSEAYRMTAIASGGEVWSYEDTHYSIGVQAIAERKGVSQTGYEYRVARFFEDLCPGEVGAAAAEEASGLLGGEQPDSGRYPVLLPPRAVVSFLGVLLSSFSAEEVQKSRSRLAGRIGQKVFSPVVTLLDDGALSRGVGTVPFDDERVRPVSRQLVEKGILKGFLHSLTTAAREGVEPTGNGFRSSLSAHPVPAATNLILKQGRSPLIDQVPPGKAVQLVSLMGVHTADRVSGDFSMGVSGFFLQDGNRVRPFRNGTVSGNVFDLFSTIQGVGDDLTFYGSVGAPSLLVESLVISGK